MTYSKRVASTIGDCGTDKTAAATGDCINRAKIEINLDRPLDLYRFRNQII